MGLAVKWWVFSGNPLFARLQKTWCQSTRHSASRLYSLVLAFVNTLTQSFKCQKRIPSERGVIHVEESWRPQLEGNSREKAERHDVVWTPHQVRGRWRRHSGKDLHAYFIHNRQLPSGIRPNSVRQLPTDGRVPNLLLRRLPLLIRKRHFKVVPRNQTPLSWCTNTRRRH